MRTAFVSASPAQLLVAVLRELERHYPGDPGDTRALCAATIVKRGLASVDAAGRVAFAAGVEKHAPKLGPPPSPPPTTDAAVAGYDFRSDSVKAGRAAARAAYVRANEARLRDHLPPPETPAFAGVLADAPRVDKGQSAAQRDPEVMRERTRGGLDLIRQRQKLHAAAERVRLRMPPSPTEDDPK